MLACPHSVYSPCRPKKGLLHAFDAKKAINYKWRVESFGNSDVLLILIETINREVKDILASTQQILTRFWGESWVRQDTF